MHNPHIEKFFQKLLYVIEILLAALTIVVLVGNLGMEAYRVIIDPSYFPTSDLFLQNILSIVVGLEFVRMLIDLTPGNLMEVVTVAIARNIILTHDDSITIIVSVVALAVMFAIRHFFLQHKDLHASISTFFSACSKEKKNPEKDTETH